MIQDLPSLSTDLAASLQKLKKFDNEQVTATQTAELHHTQLNLRQLAALDMTFEIDDDSGGMGA
jgi:hypothetical protein